MPTTSPEHPGLHVLVVDDSPLQLAQMRAHLAARGHHVLEAKNGAEALIVLQSEHPDLIISDCVMPLLDGYQLCRLLKDDRGTRHIPLVLLTSMGTSLSPFWARICGADLFLHKSPDLERIVAESLALVPGPAAEPGRRRVRPLGPEDMGVEAIQRRLAEALEHRLLETSLRDAVTKLYTMTGDTPDLVNHFFALIQDLVLPGAALVVFHDDRTLVAKGLRGRGVTEGEAEDLLHAALHALEASQDPAAHWELPPPDEPSDALLDPVRLHLPLALPHVAPYGCLSVLLERRTAETHERLFEVAAQELGRLLSLEETRLKLYHMAIEDPLTGLPNRRRLNQLLEREVELAVRYQKTFSLLMVDVDNFKHANDTLGHQAGDEILQEVGRRLEGLLRKTDTLGRWGGDEFLVVCTQTDHDKALILGERLRKDIREAAFPGLGGPGGLTLSVGITTWKGDQDDLDALLRRADDRMYRAKEQGRDQVVAESDRR